MRRNRKRPNMTTARTWNLKLTATDDHPETTIEGVSQEAATKILRGLMYGPSARRSTPHVELAVAAGPPQARPPTPRRARRVEQGEPSRGAAGARYIYHWIYSAMDSAATSFACARACRPDADRAGAARGHVSGDDLGIRARAQGAIGRDARASAGGRRARLTTVPASAPVVRPTRAQLARAGRALVDVMLLAEALPTRHSPELRFPPLIRFPAAPRFRLIMTLPERLVALHRALARRRIPHAFGGAIALAYWTLDPRATSDIDINVFLPAADAGEAAPRAAAGGRAAGRDGRGDRTRRADPAVVGRDAGRPVLRHRAGARRRRSPPGERALCENADPGAGTGGARGLQGDVRPHARLGGHRGDARSRELDLDAVREVAADDVRRRRPPLRAARRGAAPGAPRHRRVFGKLKNRLRVHRCGSLGRWSSGMPGISGSNGLCTPSRRLRCSRERTPQQ